MNNDATEAALGLLGLSPHNLLPPSLVPLKRKQSTVHTRSDDHSSEAISCICGFIYDDGFSIACDDCSKWCHAACFDIVEGEVPEEWRCWECVPRPVDREKAVKLQKARQKQAQELGLERQRSRPSPSIERKHRRASAAAIEGGGNSKRKRRSSINVLPQQPTEDEHVDIDEPWTHSYVPITHDIIPHQDTRDKLRRQAQHWRGVTALQSPSTSSPYSTTPVRLLDESLPHTTVQPLPNSSFSHPTISLNTNPSVRPPAYAMHTTTPIPSAHLITPYTSTIIPSSAYLSDPLNAYAHLGMPKPFVHLLGPPLDITLDSRITGDKGRFVRSGCRPNAVLRPVLCPTAKNREEDTPSDNDSLTFGVFALRDLKANEEVVLGWEWDDGNAVHSLPALIESPHTFPLPCSNDTNSPHRLQHLRNQMTNILHALSSTFTTCACGSKATDCVLTQMAAFVDGEVQTPVDLGPLVGVERGFMTKEKVPWSGGMSGVEMVTEGGMTPEWRPGSNTLPLPVLTLSPATGSPTPRKSSWWKGKGRAVDYREGEGESDSESSLASGQEGGSLSRPTDKQPTHRRVTIDSSLLASPQPRHRPLSLHPRKSSSDDERMHVAEEEEQEGKMPPKMRKRWIHRSLEALKDSNARNSASPSGSAASLGSEVGRELRNGIGLGIRMGDESDSLKDTMGGGEANDSMEVDDAGPLVSTTPMLPPPIPASLDPTTISSVDSWSTENLRSSLHNARPSPSPSPSIMSTSPSTSFAKLSLLSPIVTPVSSYFVPRSDNRSTSPRPSLIPLRNDAKDDDESAAGPAEAVADRDGDGDGEKREADEPTAEASKTVAVDDMPNRLGSPGLPWSDPVPSNEPRNSQVEPRRSVSPPQPQHPQSPESNQHANPSSFKEVPHEEPRSNSPHTPQWSPPQADYSWVAPTSFRPPSPPPPLQPPPKVKMSLKDFAMRKKKQREEMAKNSSSPSSVRSVLDVASPNMNGKDIEISDHEETKPDQTKDSTSAPSFGAPTNGDVDRLSISAPPGVQGQPLMSSPVPTSSQPLTRILKNGIHGIRLHEQVSSLQAKVELIEEHIPRGLVAADDNEHEVSRFPPPPLNGDVNRFSGQQLTMPPVHDFRVHSRRPSQEDGEIPSSSTPPKQKQYASFVPRSHTPPTQPRSFHAAPTPPSLPAPAPSTSAPVQGRRSSQPPPPQAHRPQTQPHTQNAMPPSSRPLPSGPRALRAANPMGHYPPSRPSSSQPQFIPRGPSADRERLEWDRERGWPPRTRGRGGSGSGWR